MNDDIEEIIQNIESVQMQFGNRRVIELFEENILKVKNPELSYLFVSKFAEADMKAHEQVVLESKDPEWNYKFVRYIKGADIPAHRNVVINSGSPFWIKEFKDNIVIINTKYLNDINNRILSLLPNNKQ